MKIIVQSEDKNLKIYLPMRLVMSKSVIRLGFKGNKEVETHLPLINSCYHILKEYIKLNGHFTLVEIESADNHIKIEV